jgi:tetratricopeptide (TPR) repeat protein
MKKKLKSNQKTKRKKKKITPLVSSASIHTPYFLVAIFNSLKKVKRDYLAFSVFFILVVVFYGNTLFNGFILDDNAVIRDNPYVHSLKYAPKVVTGCIWEYAIGGCKDKTLHYRPIHTLTYLLAWQFSQQPWFFHLINLLYFFAAIVLVYIFIKALTKNYKIAFLTALFFIIHPINNEVVNWISAVSELTLAVFSLLMLFHYIKYRQNNDKKSFILAILFYFLAMLSKEPAIIVLPPVILCLDLLFFKKIKELLVKEEIKKYLFFGIPAFIYLLMRQLAIGGIAGISHRESYFGGFSLTDRIYYFFWLFFRYLEKLFYPYPLIFLHELKEKPNLFSYRFLFLLSFFFIFCAIFYYLIKKKKNIFAFGMAWLFIFILPMLVFYNIVGENIFAERYLFIPTIGFGLLLSNFLISLWDKKVKARIFIILFVVGLVFVCFLIIFPRNKIWKDNIVFFRSNLALNPNALPLREYLADVLRAKGDIEGAKTEWEEIIKRNPKWKFVSHAYNNLGEYYRAKGDLEKARENYEKAIETGEAINNYKGYNNLGALMMEQNQYLNALLYFCKALKLDSSAPEPLNNFNRVASMVASVDPENFIFLYMDVMDGQEFKKSEEQKIVFKRKECLYGNCLYFFSPQLPQNEIMLPFLIMAKAFPEEIVTVKNPQLNNKTNEIAISLEEKYKDRLITFYFPTCEGVYYEVAAQ